MNKIRTILCIIVQIICLNQSVPIFAATSYILLPTGHLAISDSIIVDETNISLGKLSNGETIFIASSSPSFSYNGISPGNRLPINLKDCKKRKIPGWGYIVNIAPKWYAAFDFKTEPNEGSKIQSVFYFDFENPQKGISNEENGYRRGGYYNNTYHKFLNNGLELSLNMEYDEIVLDTTIVVQESTYNIFTIKNASNLNYILIYDCVNQIEYVTNKFSDSAIESLRVLDLQDYMVSFQTDNHSYNEYVFHSYPCSSIKKVQVDWGRYDLSLFGVQTAYYNNEIIFRNYLDGNFKVCECFNLQDITAKDYIIFKALDKDSVFFIVYDILDRQLYKSSPIETDKNSGQTNLTQANLTDFKIDDFGLSMNLDGTQIKLPFRRLGIDSNLFID